MIDLTLGLLRFMEQGEACEFCLVTDDNHWVISFRLNGEFQLPEQQIIARRIVASMNACAGIPLSLLELPAEGVATAAHYLQQITTQRDELLAAVKNLRDVKGRHHSEQAFKALTEVINKMEKP